MDRNLEWLRNNYEPYEGASLPRCALYDHYIGHCRESGLEPVNAASFGKLIRSVFKGLRTRRLGTRGNSKYHYNGIRIKESSSLLRIVSDDEYERGSAGAPTGGSGGAVRNSFRRRSAGGGGAYHPPSQRGGSASAHSPDAPPTPAYQLRARCANGSVGSGYGDSTTPLNDSITVAEYVANGDAYDYKQSQPQGPHEDRCGSNGAATGTAGDPKAGPTESQTTTAVGAATGGTPPGEPEMALGTGQLPSVPAPNLDELEECLLPLGYSVPHVLKFMDAYAANCAKVLDAIKHLRFDTIEAIWTNFWQSGEPASATDEELSESVAINVDQLLIHRLSALPQVQKYMESMDVALYQVLVEVLIPDVLRSTLTPRLSYQIRNFAKNVESWLRKAMGGAPSDAKKRKTAAVRFLANALTRYTSFNHLADAARAVLRNREQVAQMYSDFCKVDFAIVRGQADWVCDCDPALVSSIESEFKENLKRHHNLDEWTEWMEAVVDQVLAKYHDKPLAVQMSASKQFLLKWSFYSSMILRDVTYRSAQSFGSFHLIRLLYDEYMCLLVEIRLARITNQPIICVMRPGSQLQNTVMLPYELSYDMGLAGNSMLMHHSSSNASLAAYYANGGGMTPLTPSHHLARGGAPQSATSGTTMFLLNGGGGNGRYDCTTGTGTSAIVYSGVLPPTDYHGHPHGSHHGSHHAMQAPHLGLATSVAPPMSDAIVVSGVGFLTSGSGTGASPGTPAGVSSAYETLAASSVSDAGVSAPLHYSTVSCAPLASVATYATPSAADAVGTVSAQCPELSEILGQDPSLSSVTDYSNQQQQQRQQQQEHQPQQTAEDAFGAEFYTPMAPSHGHHHHHHHHQMGRIVYMEEDDELMDPSAGSQQQQQQQEQRQLQHIQQQRQDHLQQQLLSQEKQQQDLVQQQEGDNRQQQHDFSVGDGTESGPDSAVNASGSPLRKKCRSS